MNVIQEMVMVYRNISYLVSLMFRQVIVQQKYWQTTQ